jgi:hypothetical protein
MRSEGGAIALTRAVSVPLLGGELRFDNMTLRLPADGKGADAVFGLSVDHLDIAKLATAFGWPAFRGQLTGHLPRAHYANERLDFEGGLSMAMFDGRVDVSSLSMERPFGVAPTLAADLHIDDLDLLALTEVFDFGSITGRLDGRIDQLRLGRLVRHGRSTPSCTPTPSAASTSASASAPCRASPASAAPR